MPENLSVQVQASAFGRQYSVDESENSNSGIPFSPSVPKAFTGILTTRTDNDTGVITIDDPAHTVLNGDKVMVYWEDDIVAHTKGRRRMMSVTALAGQAATIDLGLGDNLPTVLTPVIICSMVEVDAAFVGNDAVGLVMASGSQEANFVFDSVAPAELLYVALTANKSYVWSAASGIANPLAGLTVATLWIGHNNTSAAAIPTGAVFIN